MILMVDEVWLCQLVFLYDRWVCSLGDTSEGASFVFGVSGVYMASGVGIV